jgi:hypothetical protein
MRIFLSVLLSSTLVLSHYALSEDLASGTTQPIVKKVKRCLFTKSSKRAPLWVCDALAEGLAVTAVGSTPKSKAGFAHMQQMALADARSHLAQKLNETSQPIVAGSEEAANKNTTESGNAIITKITEVSLEGTKVIKSTSGPDGTMYVLIGLDEAGVQKVRQEIGAKKSEQGDDKKP